LGAIGHFLLDAPLTERGPRRAEARGSPVRYWAATIGIWILGLLSIGSGLWHWFAKGFPGNSTGLYF
jgi:hypothetical protein